MANDRAETESSLPADHARRFTSLFRRAISGGQPVFACFVDELAPSDERLLRTMLVELLQSP